MTQIKPYPYICRGGSNLIIKPYYEQWKSTEGRTCSSAYELLKKDLGIIFEFIEPSGSYVEPSNERFIKHDGNFKTYSHRIYELLLRACTEVESLCKQVFDKNKVSLKKENIIRYSDLSDPMRLHEYEVSCYGFDYPPFYPFSEFKNSKRCKRSPKWYRGYNSVKHNRSLKFEHASLGNAIQAVGAVYTLLVAQFGIGSENFMVLLPSGQKTTSRDIFSLSKSPKWSMSEKYEYDWRTLKDDPDPYQLHSLPELQ
ncbi:MAG: hypothetical protein V3U87_17280 [Methylococcaceae bacterium]